MCMGITCPLPTVGSTEITCKQELAPGQKRQEDTRREPQQPPGAAYTIQTKETIPNATPNLELSAREREDVEQHQGTSETAGT